MATSPASDPLIAEPTLACPHKNQLTESAVRIPAAPDRKVFAMIPGTCPFIARVLPPLKPITPVPASSR